eukprot:TRINITY_DN18335_c0_g1_i1.p1 TRINITY_DN18335_c0_g1~~TRINITY_DN18335_c0_g1_i1.p1  ORF type:complete len:175 (+),score=26.63 TRINITY_DN18335_c0_g1_i1:1-525(+)
MLLTPWELTQDRGLMRSIHELGGRSCVLNPGDVIHVPCNWHHATLATSEGITVGLGAQQRLGGAYGCAADSFGMASGMARAAAKAFKRRDWRSAAATLERACRINPWHFECPLRTAEVLIGLGDTKRALRVLKEGISQLEALQMQGVLSVPAFCGAVSVAVSYTHLTLPTKRIV